MIKSNYGKLWHHFFAIYDFFRNYLPDYILKKMNDNVYLFPQYLLVISFLLFIYTLEVKSLLYNSGGFMAPWHDTRKQCMRKVNAGSAIILYEQAHVNCINKKAQKTWHDRLLEHKKTALHIEGRFLLWRLLSIVAGHGASGCQAVSIPDLSHQPQDGHVHRAGSVAVGQFLPLAVFRQIKGYDL